MTKQNILYGEKIIIKCNDCSKFFLKSTNMFLHKTNNKCNNFINICGKYYTYHYNVNKNIHRQVIQCFNCGKYFSHEIFFYNHCIGNECKIKLNPKQLINIPKHYCNNCMIYFKTQQSLNIHILNKKCTIPTFDGLNIKYVCPSCNLTFDTTHSFHKHIKKYKDYIDKNNTIKVILNELKRYDIKYIYNFDSYNGSFMFNNNIIKINNLSKLCKPISFYDMLYTISDGATYIVIKNFFNKIPRLIEGIFLKPCHNNIFIPNKHKNYISIFIGTKWKRILISKVIKRLIVDIIDILDDNLYILGNLIPQHYKTQYNNDKHLFIQYCELDDDDPDYLHNDCKVKYKKVIHMFDLCKRILYNIKNPYKENKDAIVSMEQYLIENKQYLINNYLISN